MVTIESSRELIRALLEHKSHRRIPWTFDFGSCKGLGPELLPAVKRHIGASGSLAQFLDYDIWIALDPDRIHTDTLPHVDQAIKVKVPADSIQCMTPLCRREGFDYERLYETRLDATKMRQEQGTFDAFGMYYFSWPGHPSYVSFLSPLEQVKDPSLIRDFPMPAVDAQGYEYFKRDIAYIQSKRKMSAAWSGSLYELSWYLRGREQILYDYYDDPGLVELIAEKIACFVEELTRKNVEAGVDVLCFYDDLGTQSSLFISPEIFRRFYKPLYKRIWRRIKKEWKGHYIFLHACGNIESIIPDLIECGLDILNPIQPEAMDVARVSELYSNELVLWGTVSVQKTLPYGNRDAIRAEIRDRVDSRGADGSLIVSPANTVGKDTPLENLGFFIEACKQYCEGRKV